MKDIHSRLKVVRLIDPQTIGVSGIGGGRLSPVLDRRGYNSVEIVALHGASASAVDTNNIVVYESNSATAASFTSVADKDLIGTEAGAGRPAGAQVSGVTMNMVGKVGYRGSKRYLRVRAFGTGHATGMIGVLGILGNADIGAEVGA